MRDRYDTALRDHFAGLAMRALLPLFTERGYVDGALVIYSERIAQKAYVVADAMLAERAKGKPDA